MSKSILGIIGGSGVYDLPLEKAEWKTVESPWGLPSDQLRCGEIDGLSVVFLPPTRQGTCPFADFHKLPRQHRCHEAHGLWTSYPCRRWAPSRKNCRPECSFWLTSFIDRTFAREKSFFGKTGCVGHVPFSHPISPVLQDTVAAALAAEGLNFTRGGTYVVMEGPQFSTLAESWLYRSWSASVIGMTNMPEAEVGAEAEICYCTVAMVTDYDSWHEDHGTVDVAKVVEVLKANSGHAKKLVLRLAKDFPRGSIRLAPSARTGPLSTHS